MSSEPIIATINGSFHWRIDPEAEIPTSRGGEDGCLVRFTGEAFEFEVPASYVYPPDLPVAVADALRAAGGTLAPARGKSIMEIDYPMIAAERQADAMLPKTMPVLDSYRSPDNLVSNIPRGPDIDRLLALPTNGDEFDAHRLLEIAEERDPELAARIDARKANDHLRRAAASGRLEVARPGKRGTAGYMPTYRLAAPKPTGIPLAKIARLQPEAMNALAPPLRDEQEEGEPEMIRPPSNYEPEPELQPARTPQPRRAQSRCLVHGVDLMSEDDLCYLCMGRTAR
jgi:hypothetical protein